MQDCVVAIDDPAKLVPRQTRRPTLRFRLDDASQYRYAFAADGIVFENDPGGQLRILGRTFLANQFDVIDINDAPGNFAYRLKVAKRFGAACPPRRAVVTNE
ncbi:MAG: hypothetical protein ABI920_14355 [Casimicrobiaceae bacterium]